MQETSRSSDGSGSEDGSAAHRPSPGYRELFEAAPDGILVVDASGRIRDANPAAERLFRLASDEMIGSPVERLVPERAREAHRAEREGYVEDPHPRPMGIGMELRGRRGDGTEFPVEISLSPVEVEGETCVIATVRDVTDRRRLREFGVGALRAAEAERRRIARELHDDAAQRLSSLLIRLRLARRADDPDRREALLDELREQLLESAEMVRQIARGLRPPELEDVGLAAAIRSHVRNQFEHADLEVELELEDVGDALDSEERLAVYRIVQEALSNVLRHAGADRVGIDLRRDAGRLVLEVEDDGRGFDPEWMRNGGSPGLGLVGMEERAHLIGAELEVRSEPARGTTVRIAIPEARRGTTDG